MDISIFLAKVLGLYLIITSISLLVNKTMAITLLNEIMQSTALQFISGTIALILGLILVVAHNIWTTDWRVIITLVAWLSLFKGIFITTFPQWVMSYSKMVLEHKFAIQISYAISFLLGVYLCYWGFELNPLTGVVE
jgi:hypothetical protein